MIRYLIVLLVFVGFAWLGLQYDASGTESDVVTEDIPDSIDALMSQSSFTAERERIERDFEKYEPHKAYELFKERYEGKGPYVQHEYAHVFGKVLYDQLGAPGVAVCDAAFSFGCYHSFFGLALMEHGLGIIHDLEEACIAVHGEKGLGCQHGIGHGVLAEVGNEEIDRALEACYELRWKGPLGGCASGVFMEYNFNVMQGGGSIRPSNGDLYSPCDDVGEQFQEACYFELPAWWSSLDRSKFDRPDYEVPYAKLAKRCDATQLGEQRKACFRGLGNIIASPFTLTTDEIKQHCATAPRSDGASYCLQGAAWLLSTHPDHKQTWQDLCTDEVGKEYNDCMISNKMI